MRTSLLTLTASVALLACGPSRPSAPSTNVPTPRSSTMDLGNFSLSLAVKDLAASRAFYEKLGFAVIHGDPAQNYLILANGPTKVGLFQGMFTGNILTFNPGWDSTGAPLAEFTDVREIQRRLQEQGVPIVTAADDASTGPAHFILTDPDGNVIMFDQHVPRPERAE